MSNFRCVLLFLIGALLLASYSCSSSSISTGLPPFDPAQGASQFIGNRLQLDGGSASAPGSNTPLRFIHVSLGSTGGNGTAESPYGQLSDALGAASQGDIVYVRASVASTIARFTIPQGVKVLSSGPQQTLLVQKVGRVILPNSGTGILPMVNGTVILNSDTEIGGFSITSSTGSGILGNGLTGTVKITDNVVRDTPDSGIFVSSIGGILNLEVVRNQVSNAATNSGIQIRNDGGKTFATADSNYALNNGGSGLFFYVLNGETTAKIINNNTMGNRATEPQESGIRFGVFNNSQGDVTISGNTSSNNFGNGVFVGTQGTSRIKASILTNVANENTGHGFFLGANEDAIAIGDIIGNEAIRNRVNNRFAPFPSGSGIFVGAQVNGQNTTTVSNNITRDNGDIGIFSFVGNNGRGIVNILNNTSTGNTRNGIEVNVGLNGAPGTLAAPGDAPEATALIANNTVQGNLGIGPPLGGGGIFVLGFNRAMVNAKLQENTVTSNANTPNAFGGIAMVSVQNAQISSTVRSNTLLGNGGANPGFTATTGVPAEVLGGTLVGPAKICLKLDLNTSDQPYILLRPAGTTLQASATDNSGSPIIQPALPVLPLNGCAVP